MKKRYLPLFLFSAQVVFANLNYMEKSECEDPINTRSSHIQIKHSQGTGVGYVGGYSTLEGFFSLKRKENSIVPFLDVKAHLFNDAKPAYNVGVGLRVLRDSISYGVNGYYDYRKTSRYHYSQVGTGLELVGSFWALNTNGYFSIGRKRSSFYNAGLASPQNASFAYFQGNEIFLTLSGSNSILANQQFSYSGVDANAIFRVLRTTNSSIDCSIGPYYFSGAYHTYAAGAKGNITLNLRDYFNVGATGSWDNLFRYRGQIEFGFNFSFGPKDQKRYRGASCSMPSYYEYHLAKGAFRNEMIVVDDYRTTLIASIPPSTTIAIDPSTGLPYHIWFVNNLSNSLGTFESPYPTIQQALAVAQENDIIYVYRGSGASYDADVTLQNGQRFWGAGIPHEIITTYGPITLPNQSTGTPNVENSMGAAVLTAANQNNVSGFNFAALIAGDTIVANGVNDFIFTDNSLTTALTLGINNIRFTDCSGDLLIQNNQFIMDPLDTGSNGILLADSGSSSSNFSILGNTFTNHAIRAINLTYSNESKPNINISNQNVFTPPLGFVGTNAIEITTNNTANLTGSIGNGNAFTGYTSDVIHLTFNDSSKGALTISDSSIISEPGTPGTRGISLDNHSSANSSLSVYSNYFENQTSSAINLFADNSAQLVIDLNGNTIIGTDFVGGVGILYGTNDSATISGSISNNRCQDHLTSNIFGFTNNTSSVNLTIQNNTLIGPDVVPGGSFPNGVQFGANNGSFASLQVNGNNISNHQSQGINAYASDTSMVTLVIDGNSVDSPLDISTNNGISCNTDQTASMELQITNNTVTNHSSQGINVYANIGSLLTASIASNTVSTNSTSSNNGINLSTSGTSIMTANVDGNLVANHTNQGVNVFSSDDSQMSVTINGNYVSGPLSGVVNSGINVGANTSVTPLQTYIITNNTCINQTNAAIQCFPSTDTRANLTITGNNLHAIGDGIVGQGLTGIQVGVNNAAQLLSATISNNQWTGPSTYQPMTSVQGIQFGGNNTAMLSNVLISDNTIILPMTTLQSMTGASGIQVYNNNSATTSGVTISGNSVSFTKSSYVDDTGPAGIQLTASADSVLIEGRVSQNTVTFAPLTNPLIMNFQANGIQVGSDSNAAFGSLAFPVLVDQNTITGIEGIGIIALNASTMDSYINIENNSAVIGDVLKSNIGFVSVPFLSGKLVLEVTGNYFDGQNSAFAGIVATNQGIVCQEALFQNNTVVNFLGMNPMIPIPGIGGGIGAVILSTGDLNVTIDNNAVSGNMPQGIFGLDSSAFGGTGKICIGLTNNHGVSGMTADNYTLLNPTMSPGTFFYYFGPGNVGTLSFDPSMADFTDNGMPCSCP